MSVSAEMYIVISLMFAVFAAVSAVGTSVVLGVGFERLRSGFETIKKQTGFFADAIHRLDEHTKVLDEKTDAIQTSVSGITTRVERVEKQTEFFFEAINSTEGTILDSTPIQPQEKKQEETLNISPTLKASDWKGTSETAFLLKQKAANTETPMPQEQTSSHGVSGLLFDYLRSEDRKQVVYH